jgi:hypothetical protein
MACDAVHNEMRCLCYIVSVKTLTVDCRWDAEAKLWYVHDSNVPGLGGEAATVEAMNALICERVPELLKLNSPELTAGNVPLELLVNHQEKLKLHC